MYGNRVTHLLEQHDDNDVAHAQRPQLDPEVERHARRFQTTSLLNSGMLRSEAP